MQGACKRLVHNLDAFADLHHAVQQQVRKLIWNFYADLKADRADRAKRSLLVRRTRIDCIFRRRTGFAT